MTNTKVEIYTTPICGYCSHAKKLLKQLNVDYKEINLFKEPSRKKEMMERSGRRTVPQIFINDESIGGCDELYALHHAGELDKFFS